LQLRDRGGYPNWPPYNANPLNSKEGLKSWIPKNHVVFSDQPWAVAWYADRVAVWLPPTRGGFEAIETAAQNLQTPVAGIVISPSSHGSGTIAEVSATYKDFTGLVLDGRVTAATFPNKAGTQYPMGVSIFDKDPHIDGIAKRYSIRKWLAGVDMVFYGDRVIPNANPQQNR